MGRGGVLSALEGRCLCGGVRFEVTEPFFRTTFCHCTFCKQISGSYGTVSGLARTPAIRVLEGEEHLRSYTPEGGSAKTFCTVCGSNLFGGGWPESESSSVRLASFGLDFDQKPEAHTFMRSVAAWEVVADDGLPRYDVRP
ncbi:MAG TPA: GFA family protein [Gaiellaceae bacterium]|nr:GFA family protein [Gaiellaceae bacterium]